MIFIFMKLNKVLLLNDSILPIGGTESYVLNLKQILESNNISTLIIGGAEKVDTKSSIISRLYSKKYYDITCDAIKNFQPDIIHLHNFTRVVSPSVIVAAKKNNVPIVQTIHDYYCICPKKWMLNKYNITINSHNSLIDCIINHQPSTSIVYDVLKILKAELHKYFIINNINHFIIPSRILMNYFNEIYPDKHTFYLPHFIDNKIFSFKKIKNYNSLLYVGRLNSEKGIDLLIKAFKMVSKSNSSIRLTIVGEGSEKNNLINLIDKLKLSEKVYIYNFMNKIDLADLYYHSTIVVIPSQSIEVGPLVAYEAMAAGRPIIGANRGGISELVISHKNGYLYQFDDYHDLAMKINNLLKSPRTINVFSQHQKDFTTNYNKETNLKSLIKIYKEVINAS
jgi:glycosyltransferase involved in cell wall biosynthesis